ncbi:MAG: hypothetical protein RR415_13700, partial [Ruthenibacterium sp.]
MKKLQRILKSVLSTALVALILMACVGQPAQSVKNSGTAQQSEDNASTGEKIDVLYVGPGTMPTDMDTVLKAINEKIEADGLNLNFKVQFIPWDAWDNKINVMLSTGEDFELMHVMQDRLPVSVYQGRGAFTALDQYIEEYGP